MLGTGTQLDPYQITTVAEFRSMNDSNAYFKLMNDLDVNDSEWASNWTQATVDFKEFDGNGHEIRNIVMSDMQDNTTKGGILYTGSSGFDRLITIKNTKFVNVVMQGTAGSFFGYPGYNTYTSVDFIRCDFSISCDLTNVSSDRLLISHLRLSAKLDQCTISVVGNCGRIHDNYTITERESTNCMWNLDINAKNSLLFGSHYIKNSVRGKINFLSTSNTIFNRGPSQCYVACEITSSSAVKFSNNNPTSTCFYDQELAGITMTAQTNVHALTTEQCKDKDYLNSIGFLVV